MSDVQTARALCSRDESVRNKLLHALASASGIVLKRSHASETRLRLTELCGKTRLDLRVYCEQGETWRPTTRGLSLAIELLPDLLEALAAIRDGLPPELITSANTNE